MEADLDGAREKISHVLEFDGQALTYTRTPGVYNRDPRRRDLFHVSVAERTIHFDEKV